MRLNLITYGKGFFFDKNKFKDISNSDHLIKPSGGLWASPIDAKYGWKEWCRDNNYGNLDTSFRFTISGKICVIDSFDDLMSKFYWIPELSLRYRHYYPDFEKLARQYDAIWLTSDGESSTRFTNPSLYGWDCESVLVMNRHCIE